MKTLKKISAAILLVLFSVCCIPAQTTKTAINTDQYNTAIGLRAGITEGLTIKHFVNSTSAFEGILGLWPNAWGFTALYEKHAPAFSLEGMNWYYGGGSHITFETRRIYYWYKYGDRYLYHYTSGGNTWLGIDGILGLEYKIKTIPCAISLDMKPYMEIGTNGGLYLSLDPGLGIKVAF